MLCRNNALAQPMSKYKYLLVVLAHHSLIEQNKIHHGIAFVVFLQF